MFRLQHGKLHREHTIASGDPVCDYWIVGDKSNVFLTLIWIVGAAIAAGIVVLIF